MTEASGCAPSRTRTTSSTRTSSWRSAPHSSCPVRLRAPAVPCSVQRFACAVNNICMRQHMCLLMPPLHSFECAACACTFAQLLNGIFSSVPDARTLLSCSAADHSPRRPQASATPTTSCCRRASSRTRTRSATAWGPTTSCCPPTRPSARTTTTTTTAL